MRDEKNCSLCNKKYKALISKYKAHILKYMPYVFFHILYVFAVTAEIRNFATI